MSWTVRTQTLHAPPLALADDEADGGVVWLRLQPGNVAHVRLDIVQLKEEEAARLVRQRDLELAILGPLVDRSCERPTGAILVSELIARAARRPRVEQRRPPPVLLGLDLGEAKVGNPYSGWQLWEETLPAHGRWKVAGGCRRRRGRRTGA